MLLSHRPCAAALAALAFALTVSGLPAQGVNDAEPGYDFNSQEQQLVLDGESEVEGRLLGNTPQWVAQLLKWPDLGEIEIHLGIRDDEQVRDATDHLARILQAGYLPAEIGDRWVPLRDWNVFYSDWIDQGGADAFLTNWMIGEARFQVVDSPNTVIVGIRPPGRIPARLRPEAWAVEIAAQYMTPEVLPHAASDERMFRVIHSYVDGEIVEGDWIPSVTGGRRRSPATSSSIEVDRIKFFTDGVLAVFSVPKYLWDPSSLVNPFADRFPRPSSPAEIVAMRQMLFRPESHTPMPVASDPGQEQMGRLLGELLQATPSEVLIEDWSRRMSTDLNATRLGEMFDDMTPEERGLWHAQQLTERLMAEGAGALGRGQYEEASTRFGHALILDPLNVSAAWMLKITRDRARDDALRHEGTLPLPWFGVADQLLRRHRNAVEERSIQSRERSETQLALRDLRTQFLEAYSDHDYRRARQIVQRILALEPNDASSLFFADLIERLLATEEGRQTN